MSDVSDTPSGDVQYEPLLAQNDTTVEEQVHGIVVQTEADLADQPIERVRETLEQRLAQAGLAGEDVDVDALARRIADRRG